MWYQNRRCSAAPPIVNSVFLVLLALFICVPVIVNGWSGADAYTVVVLRSFDTDLALQEQFYRAPAGTLFTVSREGYRILDASVPSAAAPNGQASSAKSGKRAHRRVDDETPAPIYPLDSVYASGAAYQNSAAGGGPPPYQCRLSDEWVVWTKEDVAHKLSVAHPAGENLFTASPLLLHCRLPLPQNRTEKARQQQRYQRRHAAAMSAALEQWWHTTPPAGASRCLYGDGEEALTGTQRFYEVCPAGGLKRVQHHALATLLHSGGSGESHASRSAHGRGGTSKASTTVSEFLQQMHESPSTRNAVLRDPRYRSVFEEIGRYHPRYSKPRWNAASLVWESWYPSTQACNVHYTNLSPLDRTSADAHPKSSTRPQTTAIHPQDPYWKTVVRFRCPPEHSLDEVYRLSTWTVTEARQLCQYHIEVMSDLVCGWEQELDSFHVNPVACVVLD